jgi:Mg/Co/Ni transporter MgtE
MPRTLLNGLFESLTQLDQVEHQINQLSVSEIARSLPDMPPNRQGLILLLLEEAKAIAVFKQLQVSDQAKLMQEMDLPEAIWLLSALLPIERHQIFANLPAAMREEFVSTLTGEFCRVTSALRSIMVRSL